jgi:hypothetical protein
LKMTWVSTKKIWRTLQKISLIGIIREFS